MTEMTKKEILEEIRKTTFKELNCLTDAKNRGLYKAKVYFSDAEPFLKKISLLLLFFDEAVNLLKEAFFENSGMYISKDIKKFLDQFQKLTCQEHDQSTDASTHNRRSISR